MLSLRNLAVFSVVGPTLVSVLVYNYRPHSSTALFEDAERRVLQTHIKNSSFELRDVPISDSRHLHTLIVNEKQHDPQKPNLVLMHGWSSGLALWAKNVDELSRHYNVYAVDLLGFGRSARPFFPRAPRATPEQAKSFWLDSFHEWKKIMFGEEPIVLVGHSLGGFLACSYALEQPDHLSRVILAAPVGIAPWKFNAEGSTGRKIIRYLVWNVGITPQSLFRFTGYFSQTLWKRLGEASNYRELDEDGWNYLYQAQMGAASGDRAFMNLLTQDGWGYPLFEKLADIKVPGRIIYGARDYVRPEFAPEVMKQTSMLDYRVVPDAGHHMYYSHPALFNDAIISFHPVKKQ